MEEERRIAPSVINPLFEHAPLRACTSLLHSDMGSLTDQSLDQVDVQSCVSRGVRRERDDMTGAAGGLVGVLVGLGWQWEEAAVAC